MIKLDLVDIAIIIGLAIIIVSIGLPIVNFVWGR